jgi:hypothetical protein
VDGTEQNTEGGNPEPEPEVHKWTCGCDPVQSGGDLVTSRGLYCFHLQGLRGKLTKQAACCLFAQFTI